MLSSNISERLKISFFLPEFSEEEFHVIAREYCEVDTIETKKELYQVAIREGMKSLSGRNSTYENAVKFGKWLVENKKVMVISRPVENDLDLFKVVPRKE